jgi:hypothetical protein
MRIAHNIFIEGKSKLGHIGLNEKVTLELILEKQCEMLCTECML